MVRSCGADCEGHLSSFFFWESTPLWAPARLNLSLALTSLGLTSLGLTSLGLTSLGLTSLGSD